MFLYDDDVPVCISVLPDIYTGRHTVGSDALIACKHDGKVIWGKGVNGVIMILLIHTREHGTIKHRLDPGNRFCVLEDFSLRIKDLSLSDSGIYYCNSLPVLSLTVTPLEGECIQFFV